MIVQMAHRLNQLADRPEFYHTLFKTCNTSIVKAVNTVTPEEFHSLAEFPSRIYTESSIKLNLIEDWGGLEKTMQDARIDQHAQGWDEKSDYSAYIRQGCLLHLSRAVRGHRIGPIQQSLHRWLCLKHLAFLLTLKHFRENIHNLAAIHLLRFQKV